MDPSCWYRTSVIWRIQMDRIELPSNSYPRLQEAMKAIPRFSGLIVFGAGIGAERRQLLLRHWLETPTASFGGYHEERSVASR
jgi:hypothetical protein